MGSWSVTLPNPEQLHRLRALQSVRVSPPVLSRDFAYADNGPIVLVTEPQSMTRASVRDVDARAFAELLSGPTVEIFVGPEKKSWTLHRNLLCHHSSYFEAEFKGHEVPRDDKGGTMTLHLPEDDARGFALLMKYLYQGELEDMSSMKDEEKYEHAVACHKLYMLCDKFDMIRLKNIAMDQYRRGLFEAQLVPDAEEINQIYRTSSPTSPFRLLVTQIAARQIMDPEVDKDAETYRECFESNTDFAVDMVNCMRYLSGGMLFDDPTDGKECDYHDHSDGKDCHIPTKANGPRWQGVARINGTGRTPRKIRSTHRTTQSDAHRPTPYRLALLNPPRASAKTSTVSSRSRDSNSARAGAANTNGGSSSISSESVEASVNESKVNSMVRKFGDVKLSQREMARKKQPRKLARQSSERAKSREGLNGKKDHGTGR